jgi:hypothetical protein
MVVADSLAGTGEMGELGTATDKSGVTVGTAEAGDGNILSGATVWAGVEDSCITGDGSRCDVGALHEMVRTRIINKANED